MKKFFILISACAVLSFLISGRQSKAQTISDFESLTLPADSFWNGSDFTGGFNNGNVFFANTFLYDSLYGGYWASGFAYSNMKDSTDGSYTNLYSVRAGVGYNDSPNYGVGQNYAILRLTGNAAGKAVDGFYVSNTTYAALSMQNGDAFAKKFGGVSGNDPDWFKLSITGYFGGNPIEDTVSFYLADYRFTDNAQDYILKTWEWVDLIPLGNLDSLIFLLTSSDTGQFTMNTPAFFCMDNFTTLDSPANIDKIVAENFSVYPNPADGYIYVEPLTNNIIHKLFIRDIYGRTEMSLENVDSKNYLDISNFAKGTYILTIDGVSQKLMVR